MQFSHTTSRTSFSYNLEQTGTVLPHLRDDRAVFLLLYSGRIHSLDLCSSRFMFVFTTVAFSDLFMLPTVPSQLRQCWEFDTVACSILAWSSSGPRPHHHPRSPPPLVRILPQLLHQEHRQDRCRGYQGLHKEVEKATVAEGLPLCQGV